ncbi:MAG TPA: hypothetical protein VKB87_24555 [Myxococcaceae bacterium]|nr:hypothetical protein [Myxococcaceae bacterium]
MNDESAVIGGSPPWARTLGLIVALGTACALPLLFPGDAPFVNDEPALIKNALIANHEHRLAQTGLTGSTGFPYGPLPTWIYQSFLLISHDLSVVVFLRALLVILATAYSLAWLSRTLKLWPWFSIPVVLSPYIWFYARTLWDNSFCIPISALAFAAYLSFLVRESPASLALSIASLWALVFTHLMSAALIVPIAVHVIIARRKGLWRHKWVLLIVSAIAIGATRTYCSQLLHSFGGSGRHPSSAGWLFPLLSPRYLSASGLEYFFGSPAHLGLAGIAQWAARASWSISLVAFPLVWVGIILAAASALQAVRRARFDIRSHAAILALAVLFTQMLLNWLTGTYGHPHYYNATWIVYALFAWLTVDWLAGRALATAVCGPYAAALATTILLLIASIHRSGGTREGYGPTLANQMQIATELRQYSATVPLDFKVLNYQKFPHALETLRLLQPPPSGQPRQASRLSIVYSSTDATNGRIQLIAD